MSIRSVVGGVVLNLIALSIFWVMTSSGGIGPAPAASAASNAPQPPSERLLEQFNLGGLAVPRSQVHSGGPGKDGIPSLTDPQVAPLASAGFPQDGDRVVVVELGGQARAYPIGVLNWHEVVNDRLAGVPIAVVYCPLCDSVSVVDRRLDASVLEFGVSGLLLNSNVLMYDRTDQALWSQVALTAVSGPHAGRSLKHLPWRITTAREARDAYPRATTITNRTGHRRDYARNPYDWYFTTDRLVFPVAPYPPDLPAKERVIGVKLGDKAKAYPLRLVSQAGGVLSDKLGGTRSC